MKVEDIIAAASAETGLNDFGDEAVLSGLAILLEDYQNEAALTEAGRQRSIGSLVSALAGRMKVEDWLARHPELLERPVEKPMFVFGLPRTGTTLTINLLAADPDRRCFLRWEAFDPVPPPRSDELSAGPRFERMQAQMARAIGAAPHIAAIHHEDSDSPTECQFAMAPSFCAQVYEAQAHVPGYRQWFLHEADYRPAFRYHKRLLQCLQAEAPGRWTLKNPWHPLFLDELTEVYPDAQLVMTHRDPVEVVGSACSLIHAVRRMYSDAVDAHAIGAQMVEIFHLMIARQDAYRAKHGADAIFDIQYDAQMRDPVGQMKRLYDHFGEPLTARAEAAMTAFLADNPKGRHGRHEYRLEDYGLDAAGVRREFADYVERFRIPTRS
ncbi:sulfotransferase [Novosphingobium sp. ST904]|uniref:sulfotransferase family protein n=1 Tax=Novosphingobium sp. ST904 TaxID=1684385 RepID=UPI0006C853D7|nr:sulfotransferase [Novosphingobium sp. ST904]KPH62571.1 sulfotransferase [Novosphingobium sp. ST904]TCM33055.1 sulfotransferase family protein [Novosphingobium sp. ST904]